MELTNLVKPELLILVPVLYLLGSGVKKSNIADKFIPLILGCSGVFLALLYVLTVEPFGVNAIFAALTQGILCAGLSVYANQIYKQLANNEGSDADKEA
jgi:low temperature requirement protein LtrA